MLFSMNRRLGVALGFTCLLAVVSLLRPIQLRSVVEPFPRGQGRIDGSSATGAVNSDRPGNMAPNTRGPSGWRMSVFEPAARDPFAPVAFVSAPPAPMAPPPPAPNVQEPAPPVSMLYRFLGHMDTPSGEHVVYLSGDGDQAVTAKVRDRLEGGWVVDGIDGDGVHLVHQGTLQRAVVGIPTSH